MKLIVHRLPEDVVYRDVAGIPKDYRRDSNGRRIARGQVCKLVCAETSKGAFVLLHGSSREGAHISIDNRTSRRLGVSEDYPYEFELRRCGFSGEVRWLLGSGDVVHRLSFKVALVSFLVGFVGVLLGIWALLTARH